ncbi:TPA: hypothetical protein ACH3X1_004130 [Trebouxia sp. C0004]
MPESQVVMFCTNPSCASGLDFRPGTWRKWGKSKSAFFTQNALHKCGAPDSGVGKNYSYIHKRDIDKESGWRFVDATTEEGKKALEESKWSKGDNLVWIPADTELTPHVPQPHDKTKRKLGVADNRPLKKQHLTPGTTHERFPSFTEVDGVWTHTDYKQELVHAVMDYLKEECINLLKLKDLRGYGNRDMIMDRFEKRFESPVGMLVYMKECILALDGGNVSEDDAVDDGAEGADPDIADAGDPDFGQQVDRKLAAAQQQRYKMKLQALRRGSRPVQICSCRKLECRELLGSPIPWVTSATLAKSRQQEGFKNNSQAGCTRASAGRHQAT